ncbi:MAG: hypothetical protein U1D30_20110 [Planctomycetota bacterium]
MNTADKLTLLIESLVLGAPLLVVWIWALWRALQTPRSNNRWQSWIGSAAVVMIVLSLLLPNVYRMIVTWFEGDPRMVPFAFGAIRLLSSGLEAGCWFVVLNAAFHGAGTSTAKSEKSGSDF